MKRDPSKVEDASLERRVDWDREVRAGNLVPVTGLARDTSDPDRQHVQGRPLTAEEAAGRVVPAEVMSHVAETGRYPAAPTKSTFVGGWPDLRPREVSPEEARLVLERGPIAPGEVGACVACGRPVRNPTADKMVQPYCSEHSA